MFFLYNRTQDAQNTRTTQYSNAYAQLAHRIAFITTTTRCNIKISLRRRTYANRKYYSSFRVSLVLSIFNVSPPGICIL